MGGWYLSMTWGQEVCYTSLHSEPACWQYGSSWGTREWLGVKRWLLYLQDTFRSAKCHRQAAVGNWLIVYSKAEWMMVDLYTGCLNMLSQTSNQQFFRIECHIKQKPYIFGILSREDLCLDNHFLVNLLYTASTASYIKDAGTQLYFRWFHEDKFFRLNWYLYSFNDVFHYISWT